MATNCASHKWVHSNSSQNITSIEEEEEEEEEALSLCDLPISKEKENNSIKAAANPIESEQEFNFGSTESQMCAADDIFFKGQILPLRRHSVSSETRIWNDPIRPLLRSESMDHCYSAGLTGFNSRSSSIGSYQSSSSGSTTTTTKYKPRVRNQFHSHPSPTPQIRITRTRQGNVYHRSQKSSIWSFFQVGLVRTPEISLPDLKIMRNNNMNRSFGSTNSSASSNISVGKNSDKKKKSSFFGKNGALGCKCSVNVVETRNCGLSLKEEHGKEEREITGEKKKKKKTKQAISRHRTFEWLKQLSLEPGPD